MASTPSEATCKRTDRLASRNASCVSRTSPGLSSTNRTSMGIPSSPTVAVSAHVRDQPRFVLAPPARQPLGWKNERPPASLRPGNISCSLSCGPNERLLRQFGVPQPKIIDALYEVVKLIQLHRLVEVAVRLELVTFHDVHFVIRRRQDNCRNRFQIRILFDVGQHVTAVHFGEVQI